MASIITTPKSERAAQDKAVADAHVPTPTEAKSIVADQIAAVERLERTTGRSGAVSLTPKAAMLNAKDVEALHPDKHIRWCNLRDQQKVASRMVEGYKRLSSEEGGRSIGDEFALFAISKERHTERLQRQDDMNHQRLNAHTLEASQAAEGFARLMRDQYGIRVDPKRLIFTD